MQAVKKRRGCPPALKGRTVAVLGYGSQGSAQAKCLRDSGVRVVVGARDGGGSRERAKRDGFTVLGVSEAAERADVVLMLVSDMAQKEVFSEHVRRSLGKGKAVCFAHGFSIAFGLVKPPKGVDVLMIAPKATGARLREAYLSGEAVPAFLSVHKDATGRAWERVRALADAIGIPPNGARTFTCTLAEEAHANLFSEQAVTIGGAVKLSQAGFETLVEHGVPPELAYCECVSVLKLIVDLLEREGLKGTVYGVSDTAAYGGLSRGGRVAGARVKKEMRSIFREIARGDFTREWLSDHGKGARRLSELRRKEARRPLAGAHQTRGK